MQKGEDVDVERILGTGDPKQEKEWEEGMAETCHYQILRTDEKQ